MAHLAARAGPSSNASRTTVLHDSQPREERSEASGDERGSDADRAQGVLRLRGGPRSSPRVAWTEDVVDNEGMGKKKSKICCIYHKPRRFDESSSESSGSDGSDADSDSSCSGRAQPRGRLGRQNRRHRAHRPHPEGGDESKPSGAAGEGQAAQDGGGSGSVASQEADSEPNAYEKQPPVGKGKNGKGKGRAGQAQDH